MKTRNKCPTTVTVFTDSHATITKILEPRVRPGGGVIRDLIYRNALNIRNNGYTLVLRWIPSHSKILGNEKADAVAKDVAHKEGRRTDHRSSLTHIKTELQKTRAEKFLRWHQAKSQEKEARMQGFYVPNAKSEISPTLGRTLKKYAIRYYQLKVGHGAIRAFLARIRVIKTPECWWCGAQEQTVIHLHTKCQRWRREQRRLSRKLDQLGISWQSRPERRWLGKLLANERVVGPVLKFLEGTEVGSRGGARERELEW